MVLQAEHGVRQACCDVSALSTSLKSSACCRAGLAKALTSEGLKQLRHTVSFD